MSAHAVCYTATAGYLFQTVVSATQVRAHVDPDVDVYVAFIGDEGSEEFRCFREVCARRGVTMLVAPETTLQGLSPVYARLFLDKILPGDVAEVLYLDGDTQILGDLGPLLYAATPAGGVLAARDPMVFIRQVDRRLRDRIDGWWDDGGIPPAVRDDYVNSGVLRIAREDIGLLRVEIRKRLATRLSHFRFPDQDAINIVLEGRVEPISMRWNFPGFLLGTQLTELVPPRVVHFMSDPRPWHGPFLPWGAEYHQPYRRFVVEHPEVAPYRPALRRRTRARYALQQRYKRTIEHRLWQSSKAARVIEELECAIRVLC